MPLPRILKKEASPKTPFIDLIRNPRTTTQDIVQNLTPESVRERDADGNSPLTFYVSQIRVQSISPLRVSAAYDSSIISRFINLGIAVDCKNKEGETALTFANFAHLGTLIGLGFKEEDTINLSNAAKAYIREIRFPIPRDVIRFGLDDPILRDPGSESVESSVDPSFSSHSFQ